MKQCTVCKVVLTEENKHKRYARCLSCMSEIEQKRNAIYRADHKEEAAIYSKKYKSEHPEQTRSSAKKYNDSHKPQLITAQQMRRQRDSGITDHEINAINLKWQKWYPNYVIYRTNKNEPYEYSITLTVLKKRQIMGDWLKNEGLDFSEI